MELWLLDAISLVALHGSVFKIKGTSEATAKSWQKRVFYISAELFPKGINVLREVSDLYEVSDSCMLWQVQL